MHNRKQQISNSADSISSGVRPDPEVVPTAKRRTFSKAENCAYRIGPLNRVQSRHTPCGVATAAATATDNATVAGMVPSPVVFARTCIENAWHRTDFPEANLQTEAVSCFSYRQKVMADTHRTL
jgi:hypothetical protein